jgi:hypothetical protein
LRQFDEAAGLLPAPIADAGLTRKHLDVEQGHFLETFRAKVKAFHHIVSSFP